MTQHAHLRWEYNTSLRGGEIVEMKSGRGRKSMDMRREERDREGEGCVR